MRLAKAVDFDLVLARPVVKDVARMRPVESDEKLDQRRLSRARRPDECDGFAARNVERDPFERRPVGRLMLERDVVEGQRLAAGRSATGCSGRGSGFNARIVSKFSQRSFRFAVSIDHVSQFLQRSENEERIDEQRKELPHRDALREDQVEHQEQDGSPQEIDERALDEAQAAQIAHLLQLQLQDLRGGRVQAIDFLLREPEALHQLDVAQGFRGRSRPAPSSP